MWHALCTAHDSSGGRLPSGRGTSRAPARRRLSARSRGTLVVLAPGPLTGIRSVFSMLLFSRLLILTSALWPARARCGAIREATLPPCSPPLLPLPGPALPLVCPFSLVLPCPPSQAPVSLALRLPVSVFPLPPRHTLCGAIRVASLPLSLHLSALWCPRPWASGTHVALHPPMAFFPLCPPCPPLPSLPFAPSVTMQDTV